jgi:itaconyl-CoA hydratase
MTGQSVSDVSQKAVANLGWKEIKLLKPVFVGDTLYSESEVLEKRESEKRPQQGIVTIATRARNQHGEVVCDYTRIMLIWKKGFGPMDD